MIWCTSLLAWCAFEVRPPRRARSRRVRRRSVADSTRSLALSQTSEGYDHVAYFSPFTLALVVFNALTTLSCILQLSPSVPTPLRARPTPSN